MNIKQIFWSGLKAFVPMVMTIGIVFWIIQTVDTFFGHFLKWLFPQTVMFKGAGILIGIAFIFALGILVNAWMLKKVYAMSTGSSKKSPLLNLFITPFKSWSISSIKIKRQDNKRFSLKRQWDL